MKNKEKPDPALSAHYRIINGVDEDIVRRCFWKELKQKYPESGLDIPALEKKLDDIIAEGLPIWQERHAEEEKRKKEQEKTDKKKRLLHIKYKSLVSRKSKETGLLLEYQIHPFFTPTANPDILLVCRYPELRNPKVSFFVAFKDCESGTFIPKAVEAFLSLVPHAEENPALLSERADKYYVCVSTRRHIGRLLTEYQNRKSQKDSL